MITALPSWIIKGDPMIEACTPDEAQCSLIRSYLPWGTATLIVLVAVFLITECALPCLGRHGLETHLFTDDPHA